MMYRALKPKEIIKFGVGTIENGEFYQFVEGHCAIGEEYISSMYTTALFYHVKPPTFEEVVQYIKQNNLLTNYEPNDCGECKIMLDKTIYKATLKLSGLEEK